VFEPAESFASTVICEEVVFARVRPMTTVVVEDGAVYTIIFAFAAVLLPLNTSFLNVLAIDYSLIMQRHL
jgi:hypothetical protein